MREPKVINVRGVKFIHAKNCLFCIEPICLDIETSNNHASDPKELITWISSIQVLWRGFYYLFRTPEELMEFYLTIYNELDLTYDPDTELKSRVVTYIHNASYDLSYLIPYFRRDLPYYDKNDSQGIIEGPNKFLTYNQGPFEFRCSYRLSNMSLYKWSNEMNVTHKKQLGLYDYEKIIYQDNNEALTADELKYDMYDVLSMQECLDKQLKYHNDNIATTPLTFTGYVRRTLRNSCRKNKRYRENYFKKNRLDPELYYAFLKSYAGGMTHNNRFYKGIILESGKSYRFMDKSIFVPCIGHNDFKSHYPTQMSYNFPLGVPSLLYDIDYFNNAITIEDVLSYYPKYSSMSIIRIFNAELSDKAISMPFMQFSKCYNASFKNKRLDNGRIIFASGEWIMYIDNLTLDIISKQYDLDYEILKVWIIKNEPLPPEILNVVDSYFKGKSDKKNIVNELTELKGKLDPETISAQFDLTQTKTALNSIYGCTATNPLRTSYELTEENDFRIKTSYSSLEDIAEGLDKYYKGRNNFLPFQVGCFVTAMARHELFEYIHGIDLPDGTFLEGIGYDKVIYCDTDSAFYIKDKETMSNIERLNAYKRENAHFVVLENGKKEYYDNFGSEPDCIAFKGLHSKCYGVVTSHGLELTIAGVPARTLIDIQNDKPIYFTREDEISEVEKGVKLPPIMALDKLEDEYKFIINSGQSAIYIGATGNNTPREPTLVNVNGHIVSTAGGCVIRKLATKYVHDIDYDLSTYEYTDIPLIPED